MTPSGKNEDGTVPEGDTAAEKQRADGGPRDADAPDPAAGAEPEATARRRGRRRFLTTAASGAAVGAVGLAGAVTLPAYLTSPPTSPAPPAAGSSQRFAGKVVLITGATSGIGEAAARAFAAEGALVAFCGRRSQEGTAVQEDIRVDGGEATYFQADVREPEQVERFVTEAVDLYGGLDIAVNNAGVTATAPLHELSLDDWEDVYRTNTRGVFLSLKYQIPHMLEAGSGVVLVTSSDSTRPEGTAYTASKRALTGMVEAASMEYGHRGIRINAILPGTTNTAFVRPAGLPDPAWTAFRNAWGPLNVHGLHRMAEPDEIARAMLSLATAEFGYLVGSAVRVTGTPAQGAPMRMPPGFPG
ncbi:SDR family NAD(P)-dependent oxidoreductase [Streptomyces profundus]|uniref:SDR family NAD(P)-dependent oxidoreductase n=1 Tax=Streptomyces profundus TaxID=2867410 RepID=UPI001D16F82D|nr:SDR family NAD(P)-dependent oxidoreductase [Streptomyces sp. MA3_2.13]UED86140.1 SDR family oxidoreductase [Streptomyces sp. MA3_2.13]